MELKKVNHFFIPVSHQLVVSDLAFDLPGFLGRSGDPKSTHKYTNTNGQGRVLTPEDLVPPLPGRIALSPIPLRHTETF